MPIDDTRFKLARKGASTLAVSLAAFACATGVAAAQSGGTGSPGDPTAPPPSTTPPATSGGIQVFPVPGPHSIGDGFGAARGGRSHQGVDIFANCGEPEVAVMNGTIVFNAFQGSAGNYVVLRNKKLKRDYVYMHLRKPGLPKGTKVVAGQELGAMGDTGNASGCHLHFEIWKGKWYRGGRPLDPMPALVGWDTYS